MERVSAWTCAKYWSTHTKMVHHEGVEGCEELLKAGCMQHNSQCKPWSVEEIKRNRRLTPQNITPTGWHTENLYGPHLFAPEILLNAQLSAVGHLARDEVEYQNDAHPLWDTIFSNENCHHVQIWKRHLGLGVDDIFQVAQDPKQFRSLCKDAVRRSHMDRLKSILARRTDVEGRSGGDLYTKAILDNVERCLKY